MSKLWVGEDLRGARVPLVGSGRGCIGRRGRPAVTSGLGSPVYRVSVVLAPFGSGFCHWKHLLDTAKLHRGLARATAQQNSGSAMARQRRRGCCDLGSDPLATISGAKGRAGLGEADLGPNRAKTACRVCDDDVRRRCQVVAWGRNSDGARGGSTVVELRASGLPGSTPGRPVRVHRELGWSGVAGGKEIRRRRDSPARSPGENPVCAGVEVGDGGRGDTPDTKAELLR